MTNEQPETENELEPAEQANMDENVDALNELDEAQSAADNGATASNSEVEILKNQLAEAEKRVLLGQADLENFRRRKAREAQDLLKYASLPIFNGLLEVVDNLNRALESAEGDEHASSLREGVQMVAGQLEGTLSSNGCEKMVTVGEVFDPNLHEAIQMQESDEPANTILMEVQAGYKMHERVVRPAKVIIAKASS